MKSCLSAVIVMVLAVSVLALQDEKRTKQPKLGEVATNGLGMRLVYVAAGKFWMGSPPTEAGREIQETRHEVELTKDFYLGVHEVTVGQFRQFVCETKYQTEAEKDGKGGWGPDKTGKFVKDARFTWRSPGFKQSEDHPVVLVSWNDAQSFCDWLSQKEKKQYRLPTEAEWEYACRAGTTMAYWFGDKPEELAKAGNGADATAREQFPDWTVGIRAKDGIVYTAAVGSFKNNPWGLHDMHGNVWEWCADWYDAKGYVAENQKDPTGPVMGTARVQRGGGWSSAAHRCRCAARVGRDPSEYRGSYLGFRVAYSVR
ncbi:MAG: formylglycine-generating enzyme family protein [Planctomycetia bacterium]|nr:formylglycine-generating enzyme family protein [Planctomycetia bacterium]